LPEKHRVVRTTYFDLETWSDKECWTVVFEG